MKLVECKVTKWRRRKSVFAFGVATDELLEASNVESGKKFCL
jgi:hypothetical protein